MRILDLPNPGRNDGEEWSAGEVARHAAEAFGVVYTYDSACSALRLQLRRKGWVQSRKAGKGRTLFSLTAEVGSGGASA